MKKLKLVAFVFAGLGFVMMVGCSKGTVGPAGARGPAGPDSIVYSQWITLNMTFEGTDSLGDSSFYQAISASKLTSSFLDNGVLISYIGVPGSGTNGTDTLVINSTDVYTYTGGGYLTQDLLPGEIELYTNFDLSGVLYRYVLVPGSILTTNSVLKGLTIAQLKAADYSTITKALGISNKTSPN